MERMLKRRRTFDLFLGEKFASISLWIRSGPVTLFFVFLSARSSSLRGNGEFMAWGDLFKM